MCLLEDSLWLENEWEVVASIKTRRAVRFLLLQARVMLGCVAPAAPRESNAWLCVAEAEFVQEDGESGLDSDVSHSLKDLVYSTLDMKPSFHVAAPGDPHRERHWIRALRTQF